MHIVDEEDGALVGAMLLRSDVHPPAVARTFETECRLGATKKVTLGLGTRNASTNDWNLRRSD